jgi:hypothetical protein
MEINVSCTDCVHLWIETSKTYVAFFHHIISSYLGRGCKISCLPILVFNLEIMWRPSYPKIQISLLLSGLLDSRPRVTKNSILLSSSIDKF